MKLWIARDKDTNELWVYTHRPLLDMCGVFKIDFSLGNTSSVELPMNWFPEVTFKNSPKEVEFKLIKEENGNK